MSVDAFETAIAILVAAPLHVSALGVALRRRAAEHLSDRMNQYLHGDVPQFSSEAAALAVIKGAARDLHAAAEALADAAVALRASGQGMAANRAFHAHKAAAAAAEALDPS